MSAQLTAAERVAIARNPQRPNIMDYIGALFTDFFECKGDRLCGEDGAIVGVSLCITAIRHRPRHPPRGRTAEETSSATSACPAPKGTARPCG